MVISLFHACQPVGQERGTRRLQLRVPGLPFGSGGVAQGAAKEAVVAAPGLGRALLFGERLYA